MADLDLRPVQSERLYQRVIDQIRQLIIRGQLRPGQRLPSERTLMERFNVGRSTIREAFAVLETLGIIELSQGKGAFVKVEPIEVLRRRLSLAITPQQRAEVWEVIEALSVDVSWRGGRQLAAAKLEELVALQERGEARHPFTLRDDLDFHVALARAVTSALLPALLEVAAHAFSPDEALRQPRVSHRRHREILGALQQADSETAAKFMRLHLDELREEVIG